MISDIVTEGQIPAEIRKSFEAWAGCVAGALEIGEYLGKIRGAGFREAKVESEREFYVQVGDNRSMERLLSITVKAYKLEG